MTTMTHAAAIVMPICTASLLSAALLQIDSVQNRRLDPRIAPASPQRYKSIRDAKDWENPYLVIRRDGIEVIAKGLPSGRTTVARADLQRTLIALPLSAWPYGRVVAVQDTGIVAADGSDKESIASNHEAALAILNTLQVTVERWPSV